MNTVITETVHCVFNRIDTQLKTKQAHAWFVDHPDYIPDYTVLHQMGLRLRDRYANAMIHAMSPSLWYRWVWPRLVGPIQRLLLEAPVPHRNPAYDRVFIQTIQSEFERRRDILPKLSYTALFDLFGQCSAQYHHVVYGVSDIYATDKQEQSTMAKACYQRLYPELKQSNQAFKRLIGMAANANWMDSLENSWREKASQLCQDYMHEDWLVAALSDCSAIIERIQQTVPGKTIVYECDNHGEVWFDCLLVEWLIDHGCSVIMTGKERPIVNDVTADEIAAVVDQIPSLMVAKTSGSLKIISTGSRMTGRSIYTISDAYQKAYAQADEIWVKGQGNFASTPMAHWRWGRLHWYRYHKPVVYLMVVKANLIQASLKLVGMNQRKGAILIHRYE